MIDMLKNAKDLIAKGKVLNDPDLIQMGMDLLEQYSPSEPIPEFENNLPSISGENPKFPLDLLRQPEYVCENCGHTIPVDKEGRKKCPECKKHKLKLVKYEAQPQPQQQPKKDKEDIFYTQIRNVGNDRIHYDDEGNPDGIIRRREPVDPNKIHNTFIDDGEDSDDPLNEKLKKITKVSPRTRKPTNFVTVTCENCSKKEKVHPIHAGARGRYLCSQCIRRRSRR